MDNSFTYHGKRVVINQPDINRSHELDMTHDMHGHEHGHGTLMIDDLDIHIMTLQDGTFATHYFPYWSYDSLEKVAKDLIDKVPEFGPRLIKKG